MNDFCKPFRMAGHDHPGPSTDELRHHRLSRDGEVTIILVNEESELKVATPIGVRAKAMTKNEHDDHSLEVDQGMKPLARTTVGSNVPERNDQHSFERKAVVRDDSSRNPTPHLRIVTGPAGDEFIVPFPSVPVICGSSTAIIASKPSFCGKIVASPGSGEGEGGPA